MLSTRARWTAVCLIVVCCLCASVLLVAQSTGGRILGRVADPTGAVLANVKVTAANEATGVSRDTETSDTGDYTFPEVPVGVYTLTFELTGFKRDVRRGVNLDVERAARCVDDPVGHVTVRIAKRGRRDAGRVVVGPQRRIVQCVRSVTRIQRRIGAVLDGGIYGDRIGGHG